MKPVVRFILAAILFIVLIFCFIYFPIPSIATVLSVIFLVGIYDISQKKHAILRNFPVIGHFRYLLEGLGPEIRQYFIESDLDGKPLNRIQRRYIYSRAKNQASKHPFGTEHDLQAERMEWTPHSMFPAQIPHNPPRVKIGGAECKQPYESSLFNISAMSYGSLSKNAIMALNKGAQAGGFSHNTGEGSVSQYHRQGGDLVYQIGTGYFGCRAEDGNFDVEKFKVTSNYPEVKMIELKLSQGAKPGHGGILPAKKNTPEIAKIRGVEPHTTVDSPPYHKAFSNAKGLLTFIKQLRDLSNGKPVGFKLCVGYTQEFGDICEAMKETGIKPDFITVDGAEGGTGAAPVTFSDHVGMPWEDGLVEIVDMLKAYNLKKDIKIITASKIVDGFDMFKALCLGADVCNSARGMMLALGCIQALECHSNTCPTGVATSNPSKVRGLVVEDKWKRVKNYQMETVDDFMHIFAATGCTELSQLNRSMIFRQKGGKSVALSEIFPEKV